MADTQSIGVIAPLLAGGFVASMLDGIHNAARQHGVPVIVYQGASSSIGKAQLARHHVGGWILFLDIAGIEYLTDNKTPAVAVSAAGGTGICPTVLPDNWGGAQAVMRHLFEHGHEQIAFIGTMENADIQQRYASYGAALAERGLVLDPRLVADTGGYFEEHGSDAVTELLARGGAFTAIVTAGDFNALGAIAALRAAGRRVPEDCAVTGFDDVPSAQFADPPLTTVRQRPETLGELATETLLALMAGQPMSASEIFAPTALIRRGSCGCDVNQELPPPDLVALRGASWREYLTAQLVLLARYPLPLDPGVAPARFWPGAARLAEGLAALIAGEIGSNAAALEQYWREAVGLTDNLDTLYAMLKLLESAAAHQLAGLPADHSAHSAVAAWIDRTRLAMMRARLDHESLNADILDRMARTYQTIDAALLGTDDTNMDSLDWLAQTPAEWACLGLWETPDDLPATLRIVGTYQREDGALIAPGSDYAASAFPPAELIASRAARDTSTNVILLPVETPRRVWGVLALRLPTTKQITSDLHGLKLLAPRIGARLERESLLRSLREQQQTLNYAYERDRELTNTIRELGCPILPLRDRTLLVPLVGGIDGERAQQIIESVLDGVRQYQAHTILLDVTGVPLVDTQVASSLLQTADAARLLGAQTIMVGVRPEIAQSIVGLGLDLRQLATYPTLASALASLVQRA
jgi:DNA-binding LacI/PurR family transcriptional regulator/anti-anti-sigma regulatory factor